jgi:hypothetical protein
MHQIGDSETRFEIGHGTSFSGSRLQRHRSISI